MVVDTFEYMEAIRSIVVVAIVFLIFNMMRKKTGEPEHDERTEYVAGRAAQSTVIVLLGMMGVILWGIILGLFKLGTFESMLILVFTLLISMAVFRRYYNSKEV